MSSMPRARSTAVVSRPTGPPPVTSTRSSGVAPERFTVWIAIAVGSVSAAARVESDVGHAQQPRRGHDLVAAERAAREVEEVGRLAPQAHRRAAAPARAALAAAGRGVLHDARADLPAVHVGADRGDRARPLVAEHAVGPRVLLEHEVQVGAADAAVRDLDEHVGRRRARERRARAPRSRRRRRRPRPACVRRPRADRTSAVAHRSRERRSRRHEAGGFDDYVRVRRQITRTFCASSPLRPGATSNSTCWPSSSVL